MNKKNFLLLIVFLFLPLILGGCFGKKTMDQPVADGSYIYTNKGLGFALTLPKEFLYYQTQRQDQTDYQDLQIFVPTADEFFRYAAVPSYAQPITIRIYKKDAWEQTGRDSEINKAYQLINEDDSRIYLLKFWDKIPSDWEKQWGESMKKSIIDNFKKI